MAKILPRFDWSFTSKHNQKARTRMYPWEKWLDGRIWKLTQGEDFDGPVTSMERVIRTSANRKDIKVRVRVDTDEDTIILQAHTDDARTMERGVTKSPSKASLDAAKEAVPTKRLTKKLAVPAKPSVNGNGQKVARRRVVKAGA